MLLKAISVDIDKISVNVLSQSRKYLVDCKDTQTLTKLRCIQGPKGRVEGVVQSHKHTHPHTHTHTHMLTLAHKTNYAHLIVN